MGLGIVMGLFPHETTHATTTRDVWVELAKEQHLLSLFAIHLKDNLRQPVGRNLAEQRAFAENILAQMGQDAQNKFET